METTRLTVTYLKHNIFESTEKITEELTQAGLLRLLDNGMVSLLEAKLHIVETEE